MNSQTMGEHAHAFIEAMSVGDGPRIVELVEPNVEVAIGPHVLRGAAAAA